MDIKIDIVTFFRNHKRSLTAAFITVIIICSVFIMSGLRYSFRLRAIEEQAPESRYGSLYFNHLSAKNQMLYQAVYNAALSSKEQTGIVGFRYSFGDYRMVMDAVRADHPFLFYLDYDSCYLNNGWNSSAVTLRYFADTEEIPTLMLTFRERLAEVKKPLAQITDSHALALAIHDYLITDCSVTTETGVYDTVYGALVKKTATGLGYAQAYTLLSQECGLNAFTVYGTVQGLFHAWNIVSFEDGAYHLDVSYDDPDWSEGVLFHGYYAMSDDSVCDRTVHYADFLPTCPQDGDYYAAQNLQAESVSTMRQILTEQLILAANTQKHFIEIRITFSDDIRLFQDMIGEAIRQANASVSASPLRETFRLFSNTSSNGAATIEVFYQSDTAQTTPSD